MNDFILRNPMISAWLFMAAIGFIGGIAPC